MTLAIGIQRDGYVDMYADTRLSGGSHGVQVSPKIFEAHGSIYAFSGDADIDALFVNFPTPRRKKGEDFCKYFNRHFAINLEEMRRGLGDSYAFDCVIADRGEIFCMQGVSVFRPSTPYACVGSGAPAAYGVLQYFEFKKPSVPLPSSLVLDVFRSVALHNEGVAYPVDHWVGSADGRIEVVNRYEK